ncbi:hypothetical protein OAC05_02055, partial [Planktomarina temperata]|nr:hypothetical protein [Planktomarina temperata]
LITSHPADLSRVMHQRLVREYVPFASACLNSHNADKAVVDVRVCCSRSIRSQLQQFFTFSPPTSPMQPLGYW